MSNKTKDTRKRQSLDNGGVIYEPSNLRLDDKPDQRPGNGVIRKPQRPQARRKKPQPQTTSVKTKFAVFYAVTLFIGIISCLVVFGMVYRSIVNKSPAPKNITAEADDSQKKVVEEKKDTPRSGDLVNAIGVIVNITPSQQLQVFDVDNGKTYYLTADNSTELNDKYGNAIFFSEFRTGLIVDVSFNPSDSLIASLTMTASARAWERKSISGLKINTGDKTITFGNDTYIYDEGLIVRYNKSDYAVEGISPVDVISISGYKDKAYFLEVNKSHGSIQVIKSDKIRDANIEIDTNIFSMLPQEGVSGDYDGLFEVSEGLHRIVIKGENIEPFITEVVVENNKTVVLDLTQVQIATGILNVKINVEDAKLTINDQEKPYDAPIPLELGTYKLKVEREGYLTYEDEVVIDQATKDLSIELEKEALLAKLTVMTDPVSEAQIYVDNGLIGLSPVTANLEVGSHVITVKKEGYLEISVPVMLNEGESSITIGIRSLAESNSMLPTIPEE